MKSRAFEQMLQERSLFFKQCITLPFKFCFLLFCRVHAAAIAVAIVLFYRRQFLFLLFVGWLLLLSPCQLAFVKIFRQSVKLLLLSQQLLFSRVKLVFFIRLDNASICNKFLITEVCISEHISADSVHEFLTVFDITKSWAERLFTLKVLVLLGQSLPKLAVFNDVNARDHVETLNHGCLRHNDMVATNLFNVFAVLVSKVFSFMHLLFYAVDSALECSCVLGSLLIAQQLSFWHRTLPLTLVAFALDLCLICTA